VRHNIETMREAGAQIDRIAAVGGGTQGSLWTQIVSDVTGLEQQLTRTSVGASYGAAFLAACAVADTAGTAPDIADWNPVVATVRPDPATAAAYDRGYRLYRELYTSTVDLAHELARVEHEAAA
jgi:xylulokinase